MLHGQICRNSPSRFLQEIPDNVLKWLQPLQVQGAKQQVSKIKRAENEFENTISSTSIEELDLGTQTRVLSTKNQEIFQWYIGQNVVHVKFGIGIIINYEGSNADARVQVKFNRAGTKWLSLEYAKLLPI